MKGRIPASAGMTGKNGVMLRMKTIDKGARMKNKVTLS
jgi:hypothetical protein